jgi:hypothetical protein
MTDEAKPRHKSRRVIYVDTNGRHREARTLGEPDVEGKTLLLVGGGGMATVEALESGAKAAGTWHAPDQPS